MKRMGADDRARVRTTAAAGDRVGTVRVRPSALHGIRITEAEVPSLIDELPLIACVAAGAGIDIEITGAVGAEGKGERSHQRRRSESPRGWRAAPRSFRMDCACAGPRRDLSGTVDPRGDHRIAMAFGVLSAASGNRIVIENPECVAVSYPGFWEDLRRVVA